MDMHELTMKKNIFYQPKINEYFNKCIAHCCLMFNNA